MPFCPYYYNYFRKKQIYSYIRAFHAAPDTPAVDVYANDNRIASNLRFKGFTDYMKMTPGKYRIRVFRKGTKNNPLINTEIIIPDKKIYTLAVTGMLPNIALKVIEESVEPLRRGKAKVRFSHLSPGAPAVDITLPNGNIIFKNVSYGEVTKYNEISPGVYNFEVRIAGTDKKILLLPNTRFGPNKFYTIYAVGLVNGSPALQAVMPLDGNTYLKV
jgi:hypothetical protein